MAISARTGRGWGRSIAWYRGSVSDPISDPWRPRWPMRLCRPSFGAERGRVGHRRRRARAADVGGDDPGHDAADRGSDGRHLCRHRRHRRRQGRARRLAAGAGRRLCRRLARLCDRRHGVAGGPDPRGTARSRHGIGEPAVLRRDLHRRRPLPVLGPQARLRHPLPAPVPVLLRQLDDRAVRRIPARAAPGRLLHRLLLGDDDGDVRGRPDEHRLDGRARTGDDGGEAGDHDDSSAAWSASLSARSG